MGILYANSVLDCITVG